MPKGMFINEMQTGMRFGKLVYLYEVESRPIKIGKQRYGLFQCDCGKTIEKNLINVATGSTSSCGCLRKTCHEYLNKTHTTHGMYHHPLYKRWGGVKSRCYNSKHVRYPDWGGRGISMCDEWRDDFMAFYHWCINNGWDKKLQLDRIDNNGNYDPNNCRFVTSKQNASNRRKATQNSTEKKKD